MSVIFYDLSSGFRDFSCWEKSDVFSQSFEKLTENTDFIPRPEKNSPNKSVWIQKDPLP